MATRRDQCPTLGSAPAVGTAIRRALAWRPDLVDSLPMRRIAFLLLAVLAGGTAWWLRREGPRSSFSAYSDTQLDTLEKAYRSASKAPVGPGPDLDARREAALDAQLSLERLQQERFRRRAFLGSEAIGILAVLGVLLPRRGGGKVSRKDERRLADALGDPAVLLEAERRKAASLLGVSVEAPPEVIDAALAAKLAAREPDRLEGLDPGLRQVVLEQRQALQRARDLLVRGSSR